MKKTLIAATVTACALFASHAFAANADCDAKAAEKKLAGAAKASFLKKCEKDAGPSGGTGAAVAAGPSACEAKAAEKKLAGAAKNSFVKKCTSDAAAAK